MAMSKNGQKMFDLSKAMAKAGEQAITLTVGDPGWTDWVSWRKKNGFGIGLMTQRGKWGVPSKFPPTSGIDTALAEYGAGTAGKKKW